MTIAELLESLPEGQREEMADFLYSRTPCRDEITFVDIPCVYPSTCISPESSAREYVQSLPEAQQCVVLSFGRLNKPNISGCISSATCKVAA
jgi:hypothetical protein